MLIKQMRYLQSPLDINVRIEQTSLTTVLWCHVLCSKNYIAFFCDSVLDAYSYSLLRKLTVTNINNCVISTHLVCKSLIMPTDIFWVFGS